MSSTSTARIWSSTTMPRSTVRPLTSAKAVLGRMPAVTTTMSHGSTVPSANATPVTFADPRTAVVLVSVCTRMPSRSTLRRSRTPGGVSSCAFMSVGAACTTWTSSPCRACSPRAASSPSRPPPMTTAVRCPRAYADMVRVSSRVRKPNTPGSRPPSRVRMPAMGGKNGLLPVARTSVS
jgi:hypothetical protein